MGALDKDRPRGLRVPSLSSFRSKNKSSEPTPTIQLPSPSQLSLQANTIPVSSLSPADKALPPHPLPSPQSPAVSNPYPSPPQTYSSQPAPPQNSSPLLTAGTGATTLPRQAPPPNKPIPLPPQFQSPPARRPSPRSATATAPTPAPAPTPVYAPVPVPAVKPAVVQQRTPPSSEGEPEQRHSNGTNDSLDSIIPEPEPELDGISGTPNEAPSSEEDDRPFTPPEIEPVAVPLSKLHYSCYQDHRAMPTAGNVWYALPCMTCQKFDREIRHRCVFCCLRVCSGCFEELKKCPRRSLAQLMGTISVNGDVQG